MREWRATGASWAVLSGLLAFSLFLGMLPGCGGGAPGPGGTGVTVSPTSLAFVTTDTSKTLTIDGGVADTWTCTASDPWLSVTPTSGTGSAQVLVGVERVGLTSGLHTGSIVVAGAGASITVAVSVDNGFDPTRITYGEVPPDPEAEADIPTSDAPDAPTSLPSSVDLTPYLPPVGHQGYLGSCTAWAVGYAMATYQENRRRGWGARDPSHQASPAFLYAELLDYENRQCNEGTTILGALEILQAQGCSSLAVAPYTDQCSLLDPSPLETDASSFTISDYRRVLYGNRDMVKSELAAGRVVVFGIAVYSDFDSWRLSMSAPVKETYHRRVDGEKPGHHAMAVVGYSDAKGAFRIMNSWGTDWGDQGFMWMAYSTFERDTHAAYVAFKDAPPPANRPPTISSLTASPTSVKTGATSSVKAQASDPDGDTLTYSWSAASGSISGSGSTVSWKAPSSAGTYTVKCTVTDGHGGSDSDSAALTVTPNTGGYDIRLQ